MRTISANNEAILAGGARKVAHRISVQDAGGTYRDLSTYPGINLIQEIQWGESIDDPGVSWSATLIREQELLSLAPLMQSSPLNRQFNPATSYAALLQVGRLMKVEYSLQAEDDPRARSWALAFIGYIDAVDSGGESKVTLRGQGLELAIRNTYIRRERVYAYGQGADADRGCYLWPDPDKGTAYTIFAVGDRIIPTDSKVNGHFYKATSITTGIVGTTEPVWPTGAGSTVVDGGVTWTECGSTSTSVGTPVEDVMQQILNDNGLSGVTLWCPVSPSWNLQWFLVSRQSTWDELKLLADQIGWCLRFIDDAGSPRLKFFDPNRTTTTSLRSFTKDLDVKNISRLSVSLADIRNAIRVVYSDSQDLDAGGNPRRKAVDFSHPASVTKYGDLFAEIAEGSNSNIDTSAEAAALAEAVLSDLSEPTAEIGAQLLHFFPFVEVCDLYTLTADGIHFDADQKLAVSSFEHRVSAEGQSTTFALRGKPASNGKQGWFERMSDAGGAEQHQLTAKENASPMALLADDAVIGGTRIDFTWDGPRNPKTTKFETHVSTTPNFTPTNLTKFADGQEKSIEIGNLNPDLEHFVKVVPITWNGMKPVRGSPSEEVPFFPGRAKSTHLNPDVQWGRLPLNGGFETQFDPSMPPDFWFIDPAFGVWGTDVLLGTSGGVSGANYVRMLTNNATDDILFFSAEFTVNELVNYTARMWRKTVSGSTTDVNLFVFWYDIDHVGISADVFATFLISDQVGTWVLEEGATLTPPSGTRFARLFIGLDGGASGKEVDIDSVELFDSSMTPAPAPTVESLEVGFGAFGRYSEDGRIWGVQTKTDGSSIIDVFGMNAGAAADGAEPATAAQPRATNFYSAALAINSVRNAGQTTIGLASWVQCPRMFIRFQVSNRGTGVLTNRRVHVGLVSGGTNALCDVLPTVQADATLRYVTIRYDSAISPNWYIMTSDGTTASGIDTGIAVVIGTDYAAELNLTTPTTLTVRVNGVEFTKTTNLPAATSTQQMKWMASITRLLADSLDCEIRLHDVMVSRK